MRLSVVVAGGFAVPESAPLAGRGRAIYPLFQSDILHWVAKSKLLNPEASCNAAMDFDYWKLVDQFFGVGLMRDD